MGEWLLSRRDSTIVARHEVLSREGQHDRSQARSAWNHEENSPSQRDD
jgi:hypothetical protein